MIAMQKSGYNCFEQPCTKLGPIGGNYKKIDSGLIKQCSHQNRQPCY